MTHLRAEMDPPTREAIEAWLRAALGPLLGVRPEAVDTRKTFAAYGLDSMTAITLAADLETWLGMRLSPTLAWDHPTVEQLAQHLAARAAQTTRENAGPGAEVARLSDAQVDAMLRGLLDEDRSRSRS